LERTLEEEKNADALLSQLAESSVNIEAATEGGEEAEEEEAAGNTRSLRGTAKKGADRKGIAKKGVAKKRGRSRGNSR